MAEIDLTNMLLFPPTQDKSVAFKIFELGLKKYGDIPEYILAYIDYLSHLNGRLCIIRCSVDAQNIENLLLFFFSLPVINQSKQNF